MEASDIIDIIFGTLLLIGAIVGFRKGLFKELFALTGIFLAAWAAFRLSGILAIYTIENWGWNPIFAHLMIFVGVFILVMLIIKLIAITLTKLANMLMLGFINRLLGLVLGFCKTAIIISLCLNVFKFIDQDHSIISNETKDKSLTYIPIQDVVPTVMPFLNAKEYFDRYEETSK